MQKVQAKKDWTLTGQAFHKLLTWLEAGAESDGQAYLEMRRRLVAFFDHKNCTAPDELADETLNRVARRLVEEEEIVSDAPARYCYIVARYVFVEHLRAPRRHEVPLEAISPERLPDHQSLAAAADVGPNRERLLHCLDRCTEKLTDQNRELIVRYYYGEQRAKIENRRAMAAELGLTQNALSIRACRIREKLEACVQRCSAEAE